MFSFQIRTGRIPMHSELITNPDTNSDGNQLDSSSSISTAELYRSLPKLTVGVKMIHQLRRVKSQVVDYPVLRTVIPQDVRNFLLDFLIYEARLKSDFGIPRASLSRSLATEVLRRINFLRADITFRSSLFKVLRKKKWVKKQCN